MHTWIICVCVYASFSISNSQVNNWSRENQHAESARALPRRLSVCCSPSPYTCQYTGQTRTLQHSSNSKYHCQWSSMCRWSELWKLPLLPLKLCGATIFYICDCLWALYVNSRSSVEITRQWRRRGYELILYFLDFFLTFVAIFYCI